MAAKKQRTKPKPKSRKTRTTKRDAKREPPPQPPQPPPPPPTNTELEAYLRVAEQENLAKKRVAEFLERTLNVAWVRARAGSFEVALLGGLRNLLAETARDMLTGSVPESREATCFFLFGLLSSLRTVFYREAMQARVAALAAQRGHPAPTDDDISDAVFEARVFNNAAQREVALEKFRVSLALAPSRQEDVDRLLEQAKLYDALNANKGMPKA
jgi:hypothetical protein